MLRRRLPETGRHVLGGRIQKSPVHEPIDVWYAKGDGGYDVPATLATDRERHQKRFLSVVGS